MKNLRDTVGVSDGSSLLPPSVDGGREEEGRSDEGRGCLIMSCSLSKTPPTLFNREDTTAAASVAGSCSAATKKNVAFQPSFEIEGEGAPRGNINSYISSVRSDSLFNSEDRIRSGDTVPPAAAPPTTTAATTTATAGPVFNGGLRHISSSSEEGSSESDNESRGIITAVPVPRSPATAAAAAPLSVLSNTTAAATPIVGHVSGGCRLHGRQQQQRQQQQEQEQDQQQFRLQEDDQQPPSFQRFVAGLLSPFKELAGGELNFTWAYREATALHRHQLSRQSFGNVRKLPSRRGGDHWSTRLSDAHRTFSSDLQYFPLQFRDTEAESEYVAVTNYQSSLRFSVYLLLQHCLLLPVQFSLLLWDPESQLWSATGGWLLHPLILAFAMVSVFGLLLAIALLYPDLMPCGVGYFCRVHAAQVACVYSFCYTGFMSASLITGQIYMANRLEEQLEVRSGEVKAGVSIMSLITETSIFHLYVFATNVLFMDLIGPILTKWTMILHVLTSLYLTTPFIVGYADGGLFSLCTLISVATIATILTAMAYAGRLSGELQHRLLFLQWRRSRLRLMELMHERDDNSKTRTAMENVVGELEQCGKILQQMRNFEHDFGEEFHELYRIVSECRRTLLTGEKLYTVNIGKADRFSKHFLQMYSHYCVDRVDTISTESHQRSFIASQSAIRPRAADVSVKGATRLSSDMLDSSSSDSDEEPMRKQATMQWRKMVDEAERNMDVIGKQWSFSVRKLEQEFNNALFVVGAALLGPVVTDWGCSNNELCEFLHALQWQYQPNPYHNQLHAAMVGHAAVSVANMLGVWQIMDSLEKAALAVATLAHDVGHPGRTNQFFVACFDPLAVIYNDISPLENFHSCLCFRILERKSCNIFFLLSVGGFRFVRAKIIECILSTDMKQHFEDISKFRMRRQSEEFSCRNSVEDRWATLRMCVKLGDLCHTALQWSDHFFMSCAITEEFFQQGDEELRRGMSVSPLCSRSAQMDIAKSQESFLSFVARPLVAELVELDGQKQMAAEVLSTLDANMERWKTLAAEGTAVSLPPTNKQTQVRTFTLHAVRNLAGPALSLARVKTAADRGDQRHNEDRDAQAPLTPPRAPFIEHDAGTHLFDWLANSGEATSLWSPRFTVDCVPADTHQDSSGSKSNSRQGVSFTTDLPPS